MEITEQFNVTQPIEEVWVLFQDVPELARCLPGAELTSDNGDGTFDGRVSVKLGPISSSFEGEATIVFDQEAHGLSIRGRGVDRSGGSQGRVEVDVLLTDGSDGSTDVAIAAKVMLGGPIAQFGRTGLVSEVSRRLIEDFSACLHAKLEAESPESASAIEASEVRGFTLFLTSTWGALTGWIKGFFSPSNR